MNHLQTRSRLIRAITAAFATAITAAPALAQCVPGWITREFGNFGYFGSTPIEDIVEFDDGSGQARVFVCGTFGGWEGARTPAGVAKLVGNRWVSVSDPNNTNGGVLGHQCMAVYDPDGPGIGSPPLLVLGSSSFDFEAYALGSVEASDGTTISDTPFFTRLLSQGEVADMLPWDSNGDGVDELYVVGRFWPPIPGYGSVNAGVMRWSPGLGWQLVGNATIRTPPFQDRIQSVAVHNDGSGNALYVAGDFLMNNGAFSVARFNGQTWTTVGGGLDFFVGKLITFDPDGPGPSLPQLFAIGNNRGTNSHARVASFNGSFWQSYTLPDDDVNFTFQNDEMVDMPFRAATIIQENGAPTLMIGTKFMYRFVNGSFERVPYTASGTMYRYMGSHDLGNGRKLVASIYGLRDTANPLTPDVVGLQPYPAYGAQNLFEWTGSRWRSPVPSVETNHRPIWDPITSARSILGNRALKVDWDGSGPQSESIVVCGQGGRDNQAPPAISVKNALSRWDGQTWHPLGAGLPEGAVVGFEAMDIGLGSPTQQPTVLGALGQFVNDGSGFVYEGSVWRRNGAGVWGRLGTENHSGVPVIANFGSGEEFFLARSRFGPDDVSAELLRWNGSAWLPLTGGITAQCPPTPLNIIPYSNAIAFNDGTGTKVFFAARCMTSAGGLPTPAGIAAWNGTAWLDVDAGLPTSSEPSYYRLDVHRFFVHNGQLHLYANNSQTLGGQTDPFAGVIYRWNGSSWVDTGIKTDYDVGTAVPIPRCQVIGSIDLGDGTHRILGVRENTSPIRNQLGELLFNEVVELRAGLEPTRVNQFGIFYPEAPRSIFNFNRQGQRGIVFATGGFQSVGGVMTPLPDVPVDGLEIGTSAIVSPDFAYWVIDCPNTCRADFNSSGAVTVQDIFDFLQAWFSGQLAADFNNSGGVTVQDIFDFLGAWFLGC